MLELEAKMRDPASADLEAELVAQLRDLQAKRDYIMKYPESIIGSGGFDTSNPKRKREAKLAKLAAASSTVSSPRSSSLTSASFSGSSSFSANSTSALSSPRSGSEGLSVPLSAEATTDDKAVGLPCSSATSPKRVSNRPGADRRYHTIRQLVLMRESGVPTVAAPNPLSLSSDSVSTSASAVGAPGSGVSSPLRLSAGMTKLQLTSPSPSNDFHHSVSSANDNNLMDVDSDSVLESCDLLEDSFDSDDENGSSTVASPTRMVTRSSSSPFSQRTKRAHTAPSKLHPDHYSGISSDQDSFAAQTSSPGSSPHKRRSPRGSAPVLSTADRHARPTISIFTSDQRAVEAAPHASLHASIFARPTSATSSAAQSTTSAPAVTNTTPKSSTPSTKSSAPFSLSHSTPAVVSSTHALTVPTSYSAYMATAHFSSHVPASEDSMEYQYRSGMENWNSPGAQYGSVATTTPVPQAPQAFIGTSHVRTTLSQSDRNVAYFGEPTRRSPSDSSISDVSYSASTTANPTPRSFIEDTHHSYTKYEESDSTPVHAGYSALGAPSPELGCLAANLYPNSYSSYNANYPRNSRCGQCANCVQLAMANNSGATWSEGMEMTHRYSASSYDANHGYGSQYMQQRTDSYSQVEEPSMAAWGNGFPETNDSLYARSNTVLSDQESFQSYNYGSASFGAPYGSAPQQYAVSRTSFSTPFGSSRPSSISAPSSDMPRPFGSNGDIKPIIESPTPMSASAHAVPLFGSVRSPPLTMSLQTSPQPYQPSMQSMQSSNSPLPSLNVPANGNGAPNGSYMPWKKGDQTSAVLIPSSLSGYQQFYSVPDTRYAHHEATRLASSEMDVSSGTVDFQGLPLVTSPAQRPGAHHNGSFASAAAPYSSPSPTHISPYHSSLMDHNWH